MHNRWKVGIGVALAVSCSGSPPRSDKPIVAQAPIGDAVGAESPVAAGSDAAVPEVTADNKPATLAWCAQDYGHVPCAFTAFGGCAEKVGKGRTIIDDDFGSTACPAGAPPAFMTKQQPLCGRRATEKVVAKKSSYQYEASCNQRETTWANIPHEHRTCASDADCIVVPFNAQCDTFPLAKSAATRKDYAHARSGLPEARTALTNCRRGIKVPAANSSRVWQFARTAHNATCAWTTKHRSTHRAIESR